MFEQTPKLCPVDKQLCIPAKILFNLSEVLETKVFPPAPLVPSGYKFVGKLGKGGFGFVSEAIDKRTGEKVAVKVKAFEDNDLEIEALDRVKDHPNCIRLKAVVQVKASSCTYLVTELCSGGDLFDRVKRGGVMSEQKVKKIARILFKTVKDLHEKGIIHRGM